MTNLLNVAPDYQITRTPRGVWRRYLYTNGALHEEFTSHGTFAGWPLLHFARGRSPETGRIVTARGVVAIGQKAVGGIAIGQMAAGVFAFGQAAAGVVAVGQAAGGVFAVGQLGLGILLGVGQIATGAVAIGQFAVGLVGFGQFGVWLSSWHATMGKWFPR